MRRFLLPAATVALLLGGARQAQAGFCITLSVASWGNGTFGLADFRRFVWDVNGATLDLTKGLVGQPTPGGGHGEFMNLTSLAPQAQTTALPEPAVMTLLGSGLLCVASYGWRMPKRAGGAAPPQGDSIGGPPASRDQPRGMTVAIPQKVGAVFPPFSAEKVGTARPCRRHT
jgi:hypothetical protein